MPKKQKEIAKENFVSGVEKDIYDPRDYSAGAIYESMGIAVNATGYPADLDLRDLLPPIRNQGSRGTCVAQTGACMKEYQERLDTGYEGHFSPEFIYFYRANKPNTGMGSRDLMQILAERGCCTEDSMPYLKVDPNPEMILQKSIDKEAAKYKIAEYARINTIDELKTALYQNGVCYMSFPVYDVRPQFWRKKTPESTSTGGHAVSIVGYNPEGFIIRNSWGEGYGDKGYIIYPYSDFGHHWDIWTTIDSRGSPKPPPAKKDTCCNLL